MSLFAKLEADEVRRDRPAAGRAHAPAHARGVCRAAGAARPGQTAARGHRARRPRLDDSVGTAGLRQDHAGAPDRAAHAFRIRAAFSAVLSGIHEIKDVMAAAEHTRRRAAHHRLRRRSASLQQGAAGRFSAARGSRKHHLHRRDHRESFLRGDRAAAFAHARLRLCRR